MATDIQPAPAHHLEYGVLVPVDVHFDDLDAFGLLHNARYALLTERAWIKYWQQEGYDFSGNHAADSDAFNVVRELAISYEVPVSRIGTHAVHLWIDRLGTTGLTYGFRVCSADGTLTHAHGRRVLVRLDPTTLRPTPWSDRLRSLSPKLLRPED